MLTFKGVHGTTVTAAVKICEEGFKIPDDPPGHSMYGNGVYFYENSENGIIYALYWAQFYREEISGKYSAIAADIKYGIKDAFLFEAAHFNSFVKKVEQKEIKQIENTRKNVLRELFILKAAEKKGVSGEVILGDLPAGEYRKLKGCVVKAARLLPAPSQLKVVKQEFLTWSV